MIKKIRTSKATKIISFYLAIMLLLEILAPMQAYALTGGPAQPEFSSFTPIGTSDMVDLASGDFNYNIPIMDVGGYPINLAYNSGVSMDQEASWVGLGWDLNVGQINRQMRGIPDDFKGDQMIYENNLKENITYGADIGVYLAALGDGEVAGLKLDGGFGIKVNNYSGFGFSLQGGLTYQIHQNATIGLNMSSSLEDGVTLSPSVSLNAKLNDINNEKTSLTLGVGTSLNSRTGITGLTISSAVTRTFTNFKQQSQSGSAGHGGYISFLDASYTPTKRIGMESSNVSFSTNVGGELWSIEPGVKFVGYKSSQKIKESEKYKNERAYGYENSYTATDFDILDFNREKDRPITVNTTTLPVTNYTYDIYSVKGQGIAGMFRPYKNQVGYVFDNNVTDNSNGLSAGGELGLGGGVHVGAQGDITNTNSSTKAWRNRNTVISKFEERKTGNRPDYEDTYFKKVGGFNVDHEQKLLSDDLGNYDPIRIGISGPDFAVSTNNIFFRRNGNNIIQPVPVTKPIKREKRVKRNEVIQKLSRSDAKKYGFNTIFSPYSLQGIHDHHTSEIRIMKEGGENFVYGRAAYNVVKKEVTFDVSGTIGNCNTGLVAYSPEQGDNSSNNRRDGDQYFNRITTPAYAHTYLLTAVLSPDYSDLTQNGPSDDDLGTYTKFVYNDTKTKNKLYKWRVPYEKNKANYDEGLKTSKKDDKGSYIYGEKELIYIDSIITKTHVAIFQISSRKDGYGVIDENGGGDVNQSAKMYKLDKISLYSKPELLALKENAVPIKVAHFEYDYSLCQGVHNNLEGDLGQKGKLTLKKVYFTYGKSNMGMYTPYKFSYNNEDNGLRYDYNMKAYDTWGNYKPVAQGAGCNVNDPITNAEYPFVDQTNRTAVDAYASAWHLETVYLPSGGKIDVQYESDDYKYVQGKEVMQMFQVVGCGNDSVPDSEKLVRTHLYNSNRLYVKLPTEVNSIGATAFRKKYIRNLINEEIYFRFLLNMAKPDSGHNERFDYVSGYLKLDNAEQFNTFQINGTGSWYASIPIMSTNKGDGFNSGDRVNPISKAGWFFGRQYLNRFVYTNPSDEFTDDLEEIVRNIIGSISSIKNIMKSPNAQLINNRIASHFIEGKSWIRLMHPEQKKIGGGSRVKEIRIHDKWDEMTGHVNNELYREVYGQQYAYEEDDGSTSGVATYEPLGNKENPFVQPFYDRAHSDQVLAPNEQSYVELPLGESYFPHPTVTYRKVTVKNLSREIKEENIVVAEVKNNATGKVVTEFYTTFEFPTIATFTDISVIQNKSGGASDWLRINAKDHLVASQGFVIHTNDMNGKMKSQKVYAEGVDDPISGAEYKYAEISNQGSPAYNRNEGKLNNMVTTIDSQGNINSSLVGVDYEVINDFRDNRTVTTSGGAGANVATLPILPTPLPPIVIYSATPSYSFHESELKTAVTTKVIHTSGILREKIVFDAGSKVSTNNLAWDADTGEVLLTETVNEFNDKYYTFNFPAYWAYPGMRQSSSNLGLLWQLKRVANTSSDFKLISPEFKASDFLTEGDEIWVKPGIPENTTTEELYGLELHEIKAYVVNLRGDKFQLITQSGMYVKPESLENGEFRIIRSGFRNMQSNYMASVTSMINPLELNQDKLPDNLYASNTWSQYRILNTSAIEYSDTWAAQCECGLPRMQYKINENSEKVLDFNYEENDENYRLAYNPYKYNIKGIWRPKTTYAYLTGRNSSPNISTRSSGFYNSFIPFYVYNGNQGVEKWERNNSDNLSKWTYASEVAQYSPFGVELENKDALERYSSALYGYNNRFPIAVASNTRYSELAFDGFEDYNFSNCDKFSHLSFSSAIKPNKVTISTTQAHSGRKSLKMAPGNRAVIKKRIVPCSPTPTN